MTPEQKFDAWFEKEYPNTEDRQEKYRMSSGYQLALAGWLAATQDATEIVAEAYMTVRRLKGEQQVLKTLLNLSLGVIQTIDGEDDAECAMLMELQNKITEALKGAA